ncbi:HXXEE domain-containing protein [Pyruvatibacter sp.]|uniref:HXXEE domain-containing protein n=1 Tax=Pyruvatibacter sp. TaxID=1981328 RepID=UPI003266321C
MTRLSFNTALLFAPLAYALHHIEENVILDFRVWRLTYFADNNALTTEAVLSILMAITFVYLIIHALLANRISAAFVLIFLMSSQVHNVLFHLVGSVVFWHYSPGLATALLLYVPVNVLIARFALKEGIATWPQLALYFLIGGATFWAFEVFGPVVLFGGVLTGWVLTFVLSSWHSKRATQAASA